MTILKEIKRAIYKKIIWNAERFFIDEYRNNPSLETLTEGLIYTNGSVNFIEEVVNWGFLYEFNCDGRYDHGHSFNRLLLNVLWKLKYNPKAEFDFEPYIEDYSQNELKVIHLFINKARELVGGDTDETL